MAATSATAEPEISAKNSETPIVTMERPPRTKPTMAETKAISRRVMPVAFMIAPASTNIGMAISEKDLAPAYMSSATVTRLPGPSVTAMASTADRQSATAIGTLMQTIATRATKMPRRSIRCGLLPASRHAP